MLTADEAARVWSQTVATKEAEEAVHLAEQEAYDREVNMSIYGNNSPYSVILNHLAEQEAYDREVTLSTFYLIGPGI